MRVHANKLVVLAGSFLCILSWWLLPAKAAEKSAPLSDKTDIVSYKSSEVYEGQYLPSRLFYRDKNSPYWRRLKSFDDYRTKVICKSARTALDTNGTWEGHLNPDGSCNSVTSEPAIFAIGNRINYEKLQEK